MSYLVLARKYRPRNFSEMVGQEHVVQALTNALTQQRLHHAYLFTGTRGVGKTTVARILAKSLNCTGADGQGGITAEPCGVCPACTDIDAGRFVDYTELDAASNRGVDEVQSLLEQAVYKPVQGRFKVFNLRPRAPETVLEHLTRVLAAENVPADAGALRLLARAARGSMRDALSLTDQAVAFGAGRLEEAAVRQMLGSVDRSVVFSLIAALAAGDGRAVIELVDQLRAAGQSAATTLEDMASVLQRMAVRQAVPDMPADDTDPEAEETARLAALLPADETQLLYSLCIHGRAELGLAPDEYTGLTMVLLRLLPFKAGDGAAASATAEKKTLKPVERAGDQSPRPVPEPATDEGARPAAAEPASVPSTAEAKDPTPLPPEPSAAEDWGDDAGFAPPDAEPAGELRDEEPAEAPPRQAPAHPPLQPLPVRQQASAQDAPPNQPTETAHTTGSAIEVVAIQVREGTDSTPPQPRPVPAAPPALMPAAEGDFWHAVVQDLVAREAITALVRELALQSPLGAL